MGIGGATKAKNASKPAVTKAFLVITIQFLAVCLPLATVSEDFGTRSYLGQTMFTTLQEAINAANPGDTIYVPRGNYSGHIVMNKSVTLVGEDLATTTILGSGVGALIEITASHTGLSGFTITNHGGGYGIKITNSQSHNISGNIIAENNQAIYVQNSSLNIIRSNVITRNYEGMKINQLNSSLITDNRFEDNYGPGMLIYDSHNNTIDSNYMRNNPAFQIYMEDCSANMLRKNIVDTGCSGIWLYRSHNNSLSESNVTNLGPYGMTLENSHGNIVQNCSFDRNEVAFQLRHSVNNSLSGNDFAGNKYGLLLISSGNNTLQDNRMSTNWWSFGVQGEQLPDFINDVDTSNEVNGRPTYYWIGHHYDEIPEDAGFVALVNSTHINIRELNLTNGYQAVMLAYSNCSVLSRLQLLDNFIGVSFFKAFNNTVADCTLKDNVGGLRLNQSNSNKIYHNNFVGERLVNSYESANVWDVGYPMGGNYWSNYLCLDTNNDGIGDIVYTIDVYNVDHYPLAGTYHRFSTLYGTQTGITSNSTVEAFQYFEANRTIRLQVSNKTEDQKYGFCQISIPHVLIRENDLSVTIDDGLVPVINFNYTLYDNGTHRWIYFAYSHSRHEIAIVPEYPWTIVLAFFAPATMLSAVLARMDRRPAHHRK